MTSEITRQFGANAINYVTSPVHAKGASLTRLVELTAPQPHWHVLDVATAAGHTALAFAPRVAHVTGIDMTTQMLDEARKLSVARGIGNVEFMEGVAEKLPFEASRFDLVTCRIAAHHFADVSEFLRECRRVLKPGGLLAIADNISPDAISSPGESPSGLAEAADDYNAFERLRDSSHGRAITIGQWREAVSEAGFVITHEERLPKIMDFESWVRTMSVEPRIVSLLEKMLDEASPTLSRFLQPAIDARARSFRLTEIVLVAVSNEPLNGCSCSQERRL